MKKALLAAGALVALGAVALAVFGFVRYRQGQDVRGSSNREMGLSEQCEPR